MREQQDSQIQTCNEAVDFNHSYLDKLKTLKHAQAMTYQTSKKKIWHSNGLEFYRVRSGFNEVAKLRFQHESEPKSNNFKTIQQIGNSTESLKVSDGTDGTQRMKQ